MSQSLARIVVHVIYSTKGRVPFLKDAALREEVHRVLGGILNSIECPPIVIGGVEDHVHLLFVLGRTRDLASVVKEMKRGASIWLKEKQPDMAGFAWQGGYGAFSVSQSQIPAVRRYIENQEEHHKTMSFQDEFRGFLKRHGIDFDERYLWD